MFSYELLAGSLVIAAFIGVVFGTYPAFRAAKLDPSRALRYDSGFADITARRRGNAKGKVIAQIHVRDGTATAGRDPGEGDYNRPGVDHVRWEANDRADKSISIPVNRDNEAEGTEDVNLELEFGLGNAAVDPQMGKAKLLIKDVLPSGIGLAKAASALQVTDGDTVTFTFEVTNTGRSKLRNVMPADPDCHGTPKPISGDRNRDGVLDPNEKWVYECKVTLNGTALYRNRATVEAVDEAGGKVDAQAQRAFCFAASSARSSVEASKIGGLVLGMARMVVTPPASAAWVAVSQSSLWFCPGSRTWT